MGDLALGVARGGVICDALPVGNLAFQQVDALTKERIPMDQPLQKGMVAAIQIMQGTQNEHIHRIIHGILAGSVGDLSGKRDVQFIKSNIDGIIEM